MKMQYNAIKAEHPDCLLFYRLGDFYEMFDDDAVLGARELNLALTTRDRGKPEDERTPMCGVPYHSAEQYISKLIAKGYKVAVCEQMENPKLCKGLVSRDIVRIISPGTIMETSMLREGESNYLGAVMLRGKAGGCAFADVSTGEVCAASFETDAAMHIQNEISRFRPRECVLAPEAMLSRDIRDTLEKRLGSRVEPAAGRFDPENARKAIANQYGENAPELDEMTTLALGALLAYLTDAARGDMSQLRVPDIFTRGRYMELDAAARRNLELTENLRTGEKRGSLLWVLDKTKTPMGGRMLRSWVERPLLSPVAIRRRLAAVEELFRDNVGRAELTEKLKTVGDIQRLTSRAVYGAANGRDMLALGNYLSAAPEIFAQLSKYQSGMLRSIAATEPLENLCTLLRRAICDEPPFSVREGGILRSGYSEEVDRLRNIRDNGAKCVAELEAREKERTGIKKLKVGCSTRCSGIISTCRTPPEPWSCRRNTYASRRSSTASGTLPRSSKSWRTISRPPASGSKRSNTTSSAMCSARWATAWTSCRRSPRRSRSSMRSARSPRSRCATTMSARRSRYRTRSRSPRAATRSLSRCSATRSSCRTTRT